MTTLTDARPQARTRRLNRPAAFAAIAAIFVTFMAASAAPSPLYVVYQQLWGFRPSTLTVVFAVYVLGLVGSLLILGGLSDHIGRRPVLAAATALEAVALLLFLVAGDVAVLFAGRLLQGIATGLAMTALGAALVDLNPPHAPGRAGLYNSLAPMVGLGLGALGCGFLVEYAPAPTRLVWALLIAAMVLAAVAVAVLPETSSLRPGAAASLRPRLGVPARLRADLIAITPIIVAQWAVGGLYLSLGPSVAAVLLGLTNHLIGGVVVALLCGVAAVTSYALRRLPARLLLTVGGLGLTAGSLVGLLGLEYASAPTATLGTLISGVGFGASALATFGALAQWARPHERGELFAVALVIAYVAFSVPAVIAGFAATSYGLHATAVVYGLVVAGLGAVALAAHALRARRRA